MAMLFRQEARCLQGFLHLYRHFIILHPGPPPSPGKIPGEFENFRVDTSNIPIAIGKGQIEVWNGIGRCQNSQRAAQKAMKFSLEKESCKAKDYLIILKGRDFFDP